MLGIKRSHTIFLLLVIMTSCFIVGGSRINMLSFEDGHSDTISSDGIFCQHLKSKDLSSIRRCKLELSDEIN